MKLAEFNKVVNPTNEACYIIETPSDKLNKATFDDIKQILITRNDVSLKMLIPKGLIIIETKCKEIIDAIIDMNEPVMVAKKNDTYFIYAKSPFNKHTTNNLLACGVNANILTNTKKGTEILLPFHSKKNTLPKYATVTIVHSNGIGQLPYWLTPLRNSSSPSEDGLTVPITENIAKILMSHVMTLTSFTKDNQVKILKIMNKYMVVPSLSDKALEELSDSITDNFLAEFMNKNEFYHDKFGDYVIKACSIKKDKLSGQLYFYDNVHNIYTNDPDYLRGYITKLCPRLKQYQKDEAIKYISDFLEMDSVKFNSNPFNVVFKNGILHVDTMEFEPMSPEHLESIQIAANFNPDAKSDVVDEFFSNVTCGNKEVEQLLYESMGYAMLKTVQLSKSFMVTGKGRNGKSTWFDLMQAILDETNCTNLSIKDMGNNFRTGNLVGKLASIAADISSQPMSDTDLIKNVSAGDRITVEKKFVQGYEDRVFATLFFAMNKIPRTPDTTYGFYRRFVIIPFNADLTKVSDVDGFAFKRRLLSQESIDYAAYKAVLAIYNVFNTTKQFIEPECVKQIKQSYIINNSSILSWFKEQFVHNKVNPTEEEKQKGISKIRDIRLMQAYSRYADWCKDTNKQPLSRPNFEEEIKEQFGIEWEDKTND